MTAPHILPLGVHEANIIREQRASEIRVLYEALPVARIFRASQRFCSAIDECKRLRAKGYRVSLDIHANGGTMYVWSKRS